MPRDPVAVARRDVLDQAYIASSNNALGSLLMQARIDKNLTRQGLADRLGINYGTLWRFETVGGPISADLAQDIADALYLDVFEIHAAQHTIPPALRERISQLSASAMRELYQQLEREEG